MDRILSKINRAGLKFLVPLNLEETYNLITKESVRLVGAAAGALYIAEKNYRAGTLDKLIRVAFYPANTTRFVEPRRRGYTYKSYSQNKAFIINADQINRIHPELMLRNYRSAIFIPLSYHKKTIGTLILHTHQRRRFNEEELETLKLFGAYASMAIHKAHTYKELQEALNTRDLFISMAAHELRTPLTTISGYIQLLKTKIPENDSSESRWINELSWESYRLNQLVNELLEVNRIKSGQLQYNWKERSLKAIIQRVISLFKITQPHRQVIFDDKLEKGGDRVIGDYDKLLQAINNLLENAVKFSPSETVIKITLKQAKNNLIIIVADKGQGIEKREIDKVFETYYRGNHKVEGMGLGLALVKYIVANHQGEIKIKSKVNKGTKVEIILPKANYEGAI